jgi:hypothetical protein
MKIRWGEVIANVKQMVAGFFEDDMLFSETTELELITHLKHRLEKLKLSYNH